MLVWLKGGWGDGGWSYFALRMLEVVIVSFVALNSFWNARQAHIEELNPTSD